MQTVEFICLGFSSLYFLFILFVIIQWLKKPDDIDPQKTSQSSVSVIIPFRNERANLNNILDDLLVQKNIKFEIILVNDHSDDHPEDLLGTYFDKYSFISLVNLDKEHSGKKTAIEKGISIARHEIIVTLDADVRISDQFLQTHLNNLTNKYEAVAGLVVLNQKSGLWNRFQQLETLAIQALSYAFGRAGMPIVISGTNFSYKKNLFESLNPYSNNKNTLSGDDIYFLHAIRRSGAKINFIKDPASVVHTSSETFVGYFRQRIRWMKKGSSFGDLLTILSGLVILLGAWLVIFSTVYQLITGEFSLLICISVLMKMGIDFLLLFLVAHQIRISGVMFYFLPVFMMNVVFISFLSIFGWIIPVSWKGRTV